MKRKLGCMTMAVLLSLSLAACGSSEKPAAAESPAAGAETTAAGTETAAPAKETTPADGGTVANKDKPLVWFNRQPSSSATGQLDMAALNYNKDTYYVGFDANQGAELQGTMVKDYIEKNIDAIDRSGDGTATAVQDGSLEINGKTYIVRELASQEMKNSAGATWDAATAGNAIGTWSSSFGDQIDVVVSNNDGMGMSMFNAWSKDNKVPTFGYDANSDAVAAIAEGYGGTISQHADVQAYLTLRVLRNALDGVDINTGIATADAAGNVLSEDVYVYREEERSYYALNVAVTADNYQDFMDSTMVYAPVSNQLDEGTSPVKKVWLNIYNSSDNFLGSTYQPLLQKYDKLLNLDVDYIGGDGQTESNITNRLGNPSQYDAFAINMVKTDNAASYTSLLDQ
ncbi:MULTISPECIES: substrate-binding domain-containing protein [Eisenbergiella]|uniref:Substrate-binding domain-containing protein n=1 Tax=Eisenbergiella porci TaxID=2652274 RepID=A0A6N7WLM0_9FIRM|nr:MULTISPECIES: substrate-binding domain-containing protein [Eisenbergiella]MDY2655035.1 substrate-binding domain-containing protein [Eisenbergiella porci]MSS91397.1 substrate-binding domain-containing protein [Eisenbergiella porci]